MLSLQTLNALGQSSVVSISPGPDHCPVCGHGIEPIDTKIDRQISSTWLERVFRCPRKQCGHFFVGRYSSSSQNSLFRLQESVPVTLSDFDCSAEIRTLSPDFYEIYSQAQKAEKSSWKLVAGPGYRKALEFLVKDYACKLKPDQAETIKKTELGPCIQNYMTNELVRETAKRAAWLGNDESHYERKWVDKDLNDLKNLIELVETTIKGELLFEQMKADMPAGKK